MCIGLNVLTKNNTAHWQQRAKYCNGKHLLRSSAVMDDVQYKQGNMRAQYAYFFGHTLWKPMMLIELLPNRHLDVWDTSLVNAPHLYKPSLLSNAI